MFERLTDSFHSAIGKLRFHDDAKALSRALAELKKSLLKADVHHKVVKELLTNVEVKTKEAGIGQESFLRVIKEELTTILTAPGNQGFVYASRPPTVILMAGLQGSGKTTTCGKMAHYLKLRKKRVLLAAGDLQRLAAVEQLRQIAVQIEVDVLADETAQDPQGVAKAALQRAAEGNYDVLIVDTAGRLAIDDALMTQLEGVKEILQPHEIFYVADSLTGQDAVKSAAAFHEKLQLSGVILSKYDGDSKGGVALGIAKLVGVPLRFIGLGEKMADFETFLPERVVGRIMGEGDIASLAEKTSAVIDEKQAKKLTKKIKKGQFNFNDFLEQIESVKKLGNIQSLMGMIPGMNKMAGALKDLDLDNSSEIRKIRALTHSMTPKERENPDLLNNSRKRRLAQGAGLDQIEVNKILKQFKNAAKMAKKFSGKKGMQDLQNMLGQMPGGGFPR